METFTLGVLRLFLKKTEKRDGTVYY